MKDLNQYLSAIENALAKHPFKGEPKNLYDPLNYILSLGGKRLRPVLTILACEIFSGKKEKALNAAIGLEVFHNFTLMHDDIMDKAPLRRGKETVHIKWNEANAILSGDLMLVKAYELMMGVEDHHLREVLEVFNQTAVGVCEGQQMDMDFESRNDVSVEEYIRMITLKTAVLLGGCLKTGALIGGAGVNNADMMYDYGIHLGIGFQLMDDLLDVYGDSDKVGKQKGGDILANKKTFLLLSARELAKGEDDEILNRLLEEKDPAAKVEGIISLYNKLKVKQLCEEKINQYFGKAQKLLDAVEIEKAKKTPLIEFTSWLKERVS